MTFIKLVIIDIRTIPSISILGKMKEIPIYVIGMYLTRQNHLFYTKKHCKIIEGNFKGYRRKYLYQEIKQHQADAVVNAITEFFSYLHTVCMN